MPRPQLTDETYDRLCSLVDDRTRVPAEHLTTEKKLVFLLDTLEEAETRTARLADRVEELEGDAIVSAGRVPDDVGEWHVVERPYNYAIDSRDGNKSAREALLTTYDPNSTRLFTAQEDLGRWSE